MDNAPRLAGVMELVDVPDSKSGAARRGGSSPPPGTTKHSQDAVSPFEINNVNYPTTCPWKLVFYLA